MLQIGLLLIGLAGIIGLIQIHILKKQFLSPSMVKKLGEQTARERGTILAITLIVLAVIGFLITISVGR
jgi:uncharacterized membrane protein